MTTPNTSNQPDQAKTKEEKKLMGGSFAVSLGIHLALLLILGTIIIAPGMVERMKPAVGMVTPPLDVPPPPEVDSQQDVNPDAGGSPIGDPSDTQAASSADPAMVDALVIDTPTANAPRLNASPGATGVVSDLMKNGGGGKGGYGGGTGTGIGKGSGAGLFGVKNKTEFSFTGKFIDLKQTQSKELTDVGRNIGDFQFAEYHKAIRDFVAKGWPPSYWKKYYVADRTLYTQQIFIPNIKAKEGPEAFGVEKDVEPMRWVIHYSGNMKLPRTGSFRFVGVGGEILLVRLDKKLVFDGCCEGVKTFKASPGVSDWKEPEPQPEKRQAFNATDIEIKSQFKEKLVYSDWIPATANAPRLLEVLIGERGGGNFFCFLMIQWQDEVIKYDEYDRPIHTIFNTLGQPRGVVGAEPNNSPATYQN